MAGLDYAHRAAAIVSDAGGYIVGRTKLQKIGFFLEAAGVGGGFPFRYKHYGPYSEQLAAATQHAAALRLVVENAGVANWGGQYSTFHTQMPPDPSAHPARRRLAQEMVNADAVELELAATAAYLAYEKFPDPWAETARRKPDKADAGRLEKAKQLYWRLRQIPTPTPLPQI
jgi:uncharacterized protein